MPVVPNVVEKLLLLRLNRGPGPMLDLVGGGAARAVGLAIELDLFAALADEPATPADLAARLDCDPTGVGTLLSFLEPLGYVSASGGRYETTAMTDAWLLPGGETDLSAWLALWDELVFPYWDEHLETAVREGEPPRTIYEWFDEEPGRWALAQEGFLAAARLTAPEVVSRVSLPDDATDLLDVGGGHGHYSVAFCEAHPRLSATVFDQPEALDVARETVAGAGLEERISVEAGDYWTDDLPACDVALLFNVVHAHTPAENAELYERVAASLRPGGRLLVLDQFAGSGATTMIRAAQGFVGLNYLATLGATLPETDVTEQVLADAGVTVEKTVSLRKAPGVDVVVART